MKRLLIDINVVLDVLLDRQPHVEAAAALWAAVEKERVEGWIAAHGVTTVFYLVAKLRGREVARHVVNDLLAVFRVATVDEHVIRRAAALEMGDFEDAVVAAAAEAAACEAVVSRDCADFSGSPMEAIEHLVALATLAGEEIDEPRAGYRAGKSP